MKHSSSDIQHHQTGAPSPPPTGLNRWILTHDDSRLFAVLYVGLALVLSIALGLFWLIVVVALHALLEVVRQRSLHPWWPGVVSRVLWEVKLDVGLILFAFVVTLYMDVVLGVAGLNAAVRAGARGGARMLAWQRGLRAALLSVDDAAQVVRMVGNRRRSTEQQAAPAADDPATVGLAGGVGSPFGGWAERWSRGDSLSILFGAICLTLVVATPWLTGQPAMAVWQTILGELQPFPG